MPGGSRMNVIPEEILVRVNIFALRAVKDIGETVIAGTGRHAIIKSVSIEAVESDRNAFSCQGRNGSVKVGLKLRAKLSRRKVQRGRGGGIILIMRDQPNWSN